MAKAVDQQYYTVPQAAALLQVSPSTVWRWIQSGKLPAYRAGPKNIRIKKEDLAATIQFVKAKLKPEAAKNEYAGKPISEEELAKQQALLAKILADREKCNIAPLTSSDLIRKVREEEKRKYAERR